MDVPPVGDSTLPSTDIPAGWARIELEPVDIPLEQNESILLSAIQSVIPGAHGLYYKEEDCKKALKYDGTTGCILKGPPGWNSKPIYAILAHGCRHFNNIALGQYDAATERFEKTINFVQRILNDRYVPSCSYRKDTSSRSSDRKSIGDRLSRDAQTGNDGNREARANKEEQRDRSHSIRKPQEENAISSESDLRIHPSTYNIGKEDGVIFLRKYQEEEARNEDKFEKLKRQKEEVEHELFEKEKKMNDLEKTINDMELKLNEHKQYFDATHARIEDLETMLSDERNKAHLLANLNAELNIKFENLSLSQQSKIDHDELQSSREELDKKDYEIDNLNMQINDLKWSLGEHKKWLKDANDRANHLENMCKEKDYIIDDITNRLHEAERSFFEVPTAQGTEDLNLLINDLRNEVDKKNNYINELERTKNEAQWHLGEHQHWLKDANIRIGILENDKLEGWRKVCELEDIVNQSKPIVAVDDYNQMKAKVEELQQNMENKIREYDKLNEEKNEMNVSLAEHKIRLEIAEKRIKYLEDEGTENDRFILFINKELGELKEVRIDAFQQLHEKIDDLELYLSKKINEAELNDDDAEYKELRRSVKELGKDISDEDIHLNDLTDLKNHADWTLKEPNKWLQDLKNRIKELENTIERLANEKDAAIAKLYEIEQLESNMEEMNKQILEKDQLIMQLEKDIDDKQNELKSRIEELLRELNEANQNLKNIEHLKNDAEWCLGEHRQWLVDAKNRIQDLEKELEKSNDHIEQLKREIGNQNVDIGNYLATIDSLNNELIGKNTYIENLAKAKNDTEWNLGEHRQRLMDAENRTDELENKLKEIGGRNDNLQEEIEKLNSNISTSMDAIEGLQKEISDKNEQLNYIIKQKNDAEWSIGEHQQWLKDANNRISELEFVLTEKNRIIEELQKYDGRRFVPEELVALHVEGESAEAPRRDKINELGSAVHHLQNELNDKDEYIKSLEKQCNDTEWSLGEHRQWLHDSSNRIQNLEKQLSKSNNCIEQLKGEIENQNAHIGKYVATIDALNNDLIGKSVYIEDIEKAKNDAEWSLGEYRQLLQDANNRIDELTHSMEDKDRETAKLCKTVEDSLLLTNADKESLENLTLKFHEPEEASLKASHEMSCLKTENENLKELLKDKNAFIDNLVQQRNDAEWSLGEHRKWLQDCNERANWLDSIVMAKNNEIDGLRCENDRLKSDLDKISQHGDVNNLNATIENLRNEISNKNSDINEIMKQRNDTEWKLGEHRQWLDEANNRADQLAGKLTEKEQILSLLLGKHRETMEELNKSGVKLIGSELVEDDKSKLFEKLFELEAKLLETENAPTKSYDDSVLKMEHEATIAKLREDLDQKDEDLVRICKERSDAEWFLGEERQRLKDANHRIALLEEELMNMEAKHVDMFSSLKNESFEFNEKNKKLEEILTKTETVIRDLSNDAEMTMLIFNQTEGAENLGEEFKQLCDKYTQLYVLIATIQENLTKIQIKASEFANSEKIIENLNNKLHQWKAENKDLIKQKNDAEWQLGEHREWLRNADDRIANLEDELEHMKKAEKKSLEDLHMENEALKQTNKQLKEDVKHLQDEIQNLLMDSTKKFEEHICCICNEASALNKSENVSEDISAISGSLENLLKELNYQKIIDTLMEERSKAEKLLEDRKEMISNAYQKIVELEKQISESILEHSLEVTKIRTVFARIEEADEEISCSKKSISSQEGVDEIQQQLNEKKTEVKNLIRLKSELERNLKELIIRNKEMSALLDKKEETINTIINEKNAIAVERNALEQQVVNLKQRCHSLSPLGLEATVEEQNATELMVRLCEKEDQLQQVTTEIAEKAQEITNLHNVIRDLRDVISEKNRIIDDLNRITSEKEWNLGEHRQWLTDANISLSNLEAELNDIREEAKSNKMEVAKLTSELDEKNEKISQLHNKIAKLESEAINVQYEKETLPDQNFEGLREKLLHMEEYVQFQNEELQRLKKEQSQTLVAEQPVLSPTNAAIRFHGYDTGMMSEEYNELSSELITLNRKKYELEEKVKRVENELYESHEKIKYLEDEQHKMGEEVWLAKERVANQNHELENLHGQCSWLRDENTRLQNELEEERRRNIESGGVDWSKFDEMKNEMKQTENILRDEKSKVEWRLGEVTQYWNDAKWKIGELEAGMAHKEWLLDQAQQKIYELDQMYRFRDTTKSVLDGAFLIKKQPSDDRYKWRLAMWNESSPEDLKDYRRIWFEIRAPTSKIVLLSASFVSWECCLLCQKLENDADKFGVWVDIPPGRYEFLFIVDGQWRTSENYATCWNEHGTHNNWRHVD
ncbi:Adventurous-gliding motility protein [Dirofilaria immitis]